MVADKSFPTQRRATSPIRRPNRSAVSRSLAGGTKSGPWSALLCAISPRNEERRFTSSSAARARLPTGQFAEWHPEHPVLGGEAGQLLECEEFVATHTGRVGEPGRQLVLPALLEELRLERLLHKRLERR